MSVKPAVRLFFVSCIVSLAWLQPARAANLLTNPGFESGDTSGWACSDGNLAVVGSTAPGSVHSGSYCGLVSDRTQTLQGPAQSILGFLQAGTAYHFSVWVKLQNAATDQATIAVVQTDAAGTSYHDVISATVYGDRWTSLSGSFTLNVKGTLTALDVCVEGPQPGVSFYVDDATVDDDWKSFVADRTEQLRKRQMTLTVLMPDGHAASGVSVYARQVKRQFAFGSCINTNVLTSTSYADFFRTHFEWAVCENESKWYTNEATQGQVTYDSADGIYTWCNQNSIIMRGHCLYWDAESVVQSWLKALSTDGLLAAVHSRMESAVAHFKGKFRHWDINNEMVPNHYYESRLGDAIRVWMFQRAHEIDPNCVLFVNEYNVISGGSSLNACMQLVNWLRDNGAPVQAVGAQCHFSSGFDRWGVITRFDKLATLGLPIWCTEFDVADPNEYVRAGDLEDFYRIAFSHPAVQGILMWGFWENSHWRGKNACIVNANWSLNEAGRRYEALMREWTTNTQGVTDANGAMTFRGFHGSYEISIVLPDRTIVTATVDLPAADQSAACVIQLDPSGGAAIRETEPK